MNITIKRLDIDRLSPADRAALGEWAAELDDRYRYPAGCLLLAAQWTDPVIIAGSAAFRRLTPDICEVRRTLVKKDFQHHGLGHLLMTALVEQARAAGYSRMRVEAPRAYPELAAFYTREGFTPTPAFRTATLDELEALEFMEKPL